MAIIALGCEAEVTSILAMRSELRTLSEDTTSIGTKQNPLHSSILLNEVFLLRDTVQVKQALIVLKVVLMVKDTLSICGINLLIFSSMK